MLFNREPVLLTSLVRAVVLLVTAFGLKLDPSQIGAIMLFSEAVLGVITRQRVSPVAPAVATTSTALGPMAGA